MIDWSFIRYFLARFIPGFLIVWGTVTYVLLPKPAVRTLASEQCNIYGVGCPFLIIGHRGAPYIVAENTIGSFDEALKRGANALEMDISITKDGHVVIIHDRSPNEFLALGRQIGVENLAYVPSVPDIGDPMRRPVEELTLEELRQNYGYAPAMGPLLDMFVQGNLDRTAVIPTYAEFVEWAKSHSELKAVILDVKLDNGQEELAMKMAKKIIHLSQGIPFNIYFSTPRRPMYLMFRKHWNRLNKYFSQIGPILMDFESDGGAELLKSGEGTGLLTGKTLLRPWNNYLRDLREILEFSQLHKGIYPIISWTLDDQFQMYRVLQMGVNGAMTNQPRDLARIVDRHFKDHSKIARHIAMCWQNYQSSNRYEFCTSGKELDPFLSIGKREVRGWVCHYPGVEAFIRDIFGCDFLDKVDVLFQNEIDNTGNVNIWWRPKNGRGVLVARAQEEYAGDKTPFLLDFHQLSCNDGFLNYDCEYKMRIEYFNREEGRFIQLKNANFSYESSDTFISNAPAETKVLRVTLFETDDGEINPSRRSERTIYFEFKDGESKIAQAFDNTFKVKVDLRVFSSDNIQTSWRPFKAAAFNFQQKKCYDGPLNYDCEYQVHLSYSPDGVIYFPWRSYTAESSFQIYERVPSTATHLKWVIVETDDGKPSGDRSYAETIVPLRHGEKRWLQALDDTFSVQMEIKMLEFDTQKFDTEGRHENK